MNETTNPEAPAADATQVEWRDADGHIIERAEFCGGMLHGTTAVFATNGLPLQEMGFSQGRPDGLMLVHDANGQLLARLTWFAGVLDGPATIFSDGRILAEMAYRDGLLDGELRRYSEAGVLASTATYRAGRLNGDVTIYRPDGSLMRKMNYLDGLLDGETTDHDQWAVVRTRTLYKAGRRDGPMTEYDGDGNPISRTMFSADRQVGEKQPLSGKAPGPMWPWFQRLGARSR